MKSTRNCLFNPVIFALLALSTLLGLAQNNNNDYMVNSNSQFTQTIGLTGIAENYSSPKLAYLNGQDQSGEILGQLILY